MNRKAILKFIHDIKDVWNTSDNEEAKTRATILSQILDEGNIILEEWKNDLKCDPPSINLQSIDLTSSLDCTPHKEMCDSFVDAFEVMPWKHPKQLSSSLSDILGGDDNFKSAMLVGTRELGAVVESDEMYLGLTYLSPGTTYPQHAHDSTELYFTISGSAKWGPSLRHLKTVTPGNFVLHCSAQPHAFYVSILTLC